MQTLRPEATRYISLASLLAVLACGVPQNRSGSPEPASSPLVAPYVATDQNPTSLGLNLAQNIRERRSFGWEVARKAFAPKVIKIAKGQGSDAFEFTVPAWHTWYTLKDFIKIFEHFLEVRKLSRGDDTGTFQYVSEEKVRARFFIDWTTEALINYVVDTQDQRKFDKIQRDAQKIAADKNLDETDKKLRLQGTVGGTAFMLFSRSIILHYLRNAERVRVCNNANYPALTPLQNIDPAARPKDQANKFAMCFDTEFPTDAVMVKASWLIEEVPIRTYRTDLEGVKTLWEGLGGGLFVEEGQLATDDLTFYSIVDKAGTVNHLQGIHFATKEVAEWVWVSLWWHNKADQDFGADRPTPTNELEMLLQNYKMCTVSGSIEHADLQEPAFASTYPELSAALAEAFNHSEGLQWCANPYFEDTFAKSNCATCHLAGGMDSDAAFHYQLTIPRTTGLADFLQSFNTFRYVMGGEVHKRSARGSGTSLRLKGRLGAVHSR